MTSDFHNPHDIICAACKRKRIVSRVFIMNNRIYRMCDECGPEYELFVDTLLHYYCDTREYEVSIGENNNRSKPKDMK
jgi:hypothetical protein